MKISWPEFQAALLAPSFLGLDSSSSGDFSAGITFPFQQDSTVTPYLVSQLISSVSTAGPSFSFSTVLYPFTFPSSTRTRKCWSPCNTSHRHFHLELWDQKLKSQSQTERQHRRVECPVSLKKDTYWRHTSLKLDRDTALVLILCSPHGWSCAS